MNTNNVTDILIQLSSSYEKHVLVWMAEKLRLIQFPWRQDGTSFYEEWVHIAVRDELQPELAALARARWGQKTQGGDFESEVTAAHEALDAKLDRYGHTSESFERLSQDAEEVVPWSTERVLDRAPSRSESMMYSRALKGLEEKGFIKRVSRGKARYTSHLQLKKKGELWIRLWWIASCLELYDRKPIPEARHIAGAWKMLQESGEYRDIELDS